MIRTGRPRVPATADASCRFGRRLVASRRDAWISVAISYAGLVALGVPEDSLQSFPEAFRLGMAARAGQLLDYGENDPEHWDAPFGSGQIHIGVSVFSDSEDTWRRTMEMARQQYEGFPGADRADRRRTSAPSRATSTRSATKTRSVSPPSRAAASIPCPARGQPVKAGEFILGYPGEAGVPLPMPRPDVLGRNGTFVGSAQVPVACRGIQPVPARARPDRAGAGAARGEAGRAAGAAARR